MTSWPSRVAALLLAVAGPAWGQPTPEIALEDTPPEALEPAAQATLADAERAWEEGRLSDAERGYAAVTEGAPTFDRAWRRRCGVVLAMKVPEDAIPLCRQAMTLRDSAPNRVGLALALSSPPADGTTDGTERQADLDEAKQLLDEVLARHPAYLPAWQATCHWAVEAKALEPLQRCVTELVAGAPEAPGTFYYQARLALAQKRARDAAAFIQNALDAGMDRPTLEPLVAELAAVQRAVAARQGKLPQARGPQGPGLEDLQQVRAEWRWADAVPFAIVALLVLVMGALAFLGEPDSNEERDEERDAEPDGRAEDANLRAASSTATGAAAPPEVPPEAAPIGPGAPDDAAGAARDETPQR